MIVAVEIVVGEAPSAEVTSAADLLEEACRARAFPVHRLARPTAVDNRLCLYLSTLDSGFPIDELLDRGVRRNAYARLNHTQYLVRSWLAEARLHMALAARSGSALVAAARFVAAKIANREDFSHFDMQGPLFVEQRE